MLLRHQRLKLIGLAIVILFCYSLSALFQERVLRRPYDGEKFTFAFAFTAVQCIIYATVAKAVITVRDHPKNETPQRFFCIIGVFYVLGKVTSYIALRYVPYPTQVVGKSSKPIPVMLLGVLIGRKTYTVYKYIFVIIIVIGVALFTFKEKYDKKDGEDPILGIVFIAVSLLMDGFLGAFEDRMRSVKKPTPLNLMLFMNSWNSLYLITYLVFTTEGIEFFQFCQRHPIVMRDLSVVVFFGIFGQFCITSMIANFGALPLSITTTIRKFVTVLLSVAVYKNELSVRQWIAAMIIFGALFLDGYFSKRTKKGSQSKNEATKDCEIENGGENGQKESENLESCGKSEIDVGEQINKIESCLKQSESSNENGQNSVKHERCAKKKVRISFSSFDDIPENDEMVVKSEEKVIINSQSPVISENVTKNDQPVEEDYDDDVFEDSVETQPETTELSQNKEEIHENSSKDSPKITSVVPDILTINHQAQTPSDIHKELSGSLITEQLKTHTVGIVNEKTDDTRL